MIEININMDPSSMLLALIVLVLLSAVFSSSETALYSLSPAKVQAMLAENAKGAKLINKLKNNPNKMLVVILIGNNLVNVGASSLATIYFTIKFANYGVGLATGVMTLALLIFGEILPKSFAAKHAAKVSQLVVYPLLAIEYGFYPVVWLLEKGLMKVTGDHIYTVSEEEVKAMVSMGAEDGTLDAHEKELIENVMEFNDMSVSDVMTPRNEIFSLDSEEKISDELEEIISEGFSRIPVYQEDQDNILGFITVKALLNQISNPANLVKLIGEIPRYEFIRVPMTKSIYSLFLEFKKKKTHMALVYNEFGVLEGLVTMEDILEEIVGDISDESDNSDVPDLKQITSNVAILSPKATIGDLEKAFDIEIPDYDNFQNISFVILDILKRFPENNEIVKLYDLELEIQEMDANKSAILKIKAKKISK